MSETERRSLPIEIRTQGRQLHGHAALFMHDAQIGSFTERVLPGAFSRSLDRDILALVDHDPTRLLARTKSGTLRLSEDTRGLAFEIDLPKTTLGQDLLEMVTRGDVGGMSFGFSVAPDGEHWQGTTRELRSVTLFEISCVSSFPAYQGTVVSARAASHGSTPLITLARRYLDTVR